jgi:hypothetical protein
VKLFALNRETFFLSLRLPHASLELAVTAVYCRHRCTLTPRRRAVIENLIVARLVKKFPAFYGTRNFVSIFARAWRWSLARAQLIQFTLFQNIALRSILILSFHLRLGHLSGLFPSGLPTKTLCAFVCSPILCRAHAIHPCLIILMHVYTSDIQIKNSAQAGSLLVFTHNRSTKFSAKFFS